MMKLTLLLAVLTLSFSVLADATTTTTTPPPSAAVCAGCHGAQGQGIEPLGPRLAGLPAGYIVQQINLFQTGQRQNPTMQPMSMMVQGDAINQVAAYFSAMDVPLVKPHFRGEKSNYPDATERLVYQGDWDRMLPACVTCHGPSGLGVGEFPRLAGQQASYIKSQLLAWQSGTRTGDLDGVMHNVATKLTLSEIDGLSQYFATLK